MYIQENPFLLTKISAPVPNNKHQTLVPTQSMGTRILALVVMSLLFFANTALAATEPIVPTAWTPPEPAYKISVMTDGIHQLDYIYLQEAGLPVDSLDPRTFRLFYLGQEMAIQVEGESDGQFDPTDVVRFYGRTIDSLYYEGILPEHKYTGTNIYWLTYGSPDGTDEAIQGKRMTQKDGSIEGAPSQPFRQTIHQEQQNFYITEYPRYDSGSRFKPEDDHWFWQKVQVFGTSGRKTQNYTFNLPNIVATDPHTGTISAHVVGGWKVTHGIGLKLNGQTVYTNTTDWRNFAAFTAQVDIPQSLFQAGENTVSVEIFNIEGAVDESYIDWVEVNYVGEHLAQNNVLTFDGEIAVTVPEVPATTVPITPTTPISVTPPITSTTPTTPTVPVTPTVPITPTTPVTPTVPITPTTPITPTEGITSTNPTTPTTATTPSVRFLANVGPWEYEIENFTTDTLQLYDVTDLYNTQSIINATITDNGGIFSLRFGDSDEQRRYIAVDTNTTLTPSSIEPMTRLSSIFTPDDLLDPNNGADWIVITHRDFWEPVLPLANHRGRRYRVAMIDIQQIYDQFNGGMLSSESIRDFLAYTHQNWKAPAPQFVLLAGGGTSDMRLYYPDSKPTFVPTFLFPADPILGDTASDNRLVMLTGNDILPDMHIGRFPAYSVEEVATMVNKTIHYETTPTVDDWNQNVLLIADDLEGGGGNFYEFSNILADGYADSAETIKFLPEPYDPIKVYLGQTCDIDNASPAEECRADITNAINEGALFTSYVGHALKNSWAVEGLMNVTLVNNLTNNDKLSIFLAMACFEGFFHEPAQGFRSLAEMYMLHQGGGAVASWSPTGFGVATGHDWLEQGLFLSIFQDGVTSLGQAMTEAKYYMDENAPPHKYDDLIDTFLLFGDPALQVQTMTGPTAVDMAGLTAYIQDASTPDSSHVVVEWQTGNELEILGFNLLRSLNEDGDFVQINTETIWAKTPGSAGSATYVYSDQTTEMGLQYWYQLEVLKLDGTKERYGLVEINRFEAKSYLFLPIVSDTGSE